MSGFLVSNFFGSQMIQDALSNVSNSSKSLIFAACSTICTKHHRLNHITLTRPNIMRKSTLLLTVCLSLSCFVLQAQTPAATTEAQGPQTLSDQLTEIIAKSGNYRNNGKVYEVVEKYKLNQLNTNITKRIDGLQQEITTLNGEIEIQKAEIASLTGKLANTENTLTETNKEKDSMNFFGAQMSKGSYQTMMWGIAGALLLGLLLFMYKFRSSNTITHEARHKLDEVESEFEEYRKKALEKEQKLGRQLQDERNKLLKASKG